MLFAVNGCGLLKKNNFYRACKVGFLALVVEAFSGKSLFLSEKRPILVDVGIL